MLRSTVRFKIFYKVFDLTPGVVAVRHREQKMGRCSAPAPQQRKESPKKVAGGALAAQWGAPGRIIHLTWVHLGCRRAADKLTLECGLGRVGPRPPELFHFMPCSLCPTTFQMTLKRGSRRHLSGGDTSRNIQQANLPGLTALCRNRPSFSFARSHHLTHSYTELAQTKPNLTLLIVRRESLFPYLGEFRGPREEEFVQNHGPSCVPSFSVSYGAFDGPLRNKMAAQSFLSSKARALGEFSYALSRCHTTYG